jgi:hypothetical protein
MPADIFADFREVAPAPLPSPDENLQLDLNTNEDDRTGQPIKPIDLFLHLKDNPEIPKSVILNPPVSQIYSILSKSSALCFNVPDAPIYGELTEGSMEKVVAQCISLFGLDKQVDPAYRVIDLGSGVGKPSWHFAARGALLSIGVEVVRERVYQSSAAAAMILRDCERMLDSTRPFNVAFGNIEITALQTLSYFDVVYMSDDGFSPNTLTHVSKIIGGGRCRYLVSYHWENKLYSLGFNLRLLGKLRNLKLSGSSNCSSRTVYFYEIVRKKRARGHEEVVLDPLLAPVVELAHKNYDYRQKIFAAAVAQYD